MAARLGLALSLALMLAAPAAAQSTSIVFDDFNVDEGHFNRSPGFSGSSNGFQKLTTEYTTPPPAGTNPNPATADRDTTMAAEGAGSEKITLFDDLDPTTLTPNGGTARLRFLSGTGSPANNTSFTTGPGEDGWIGLAVKTDSPGWTVQLWMETPTATTSTPDEHNGGVPKEVINDNEWHIYEWNLDDFTGGPDGWGSISGIVNGSATVLDGVHTIDSIIFRNPSMPESAIIYMDYVVKTASGNIVLPAPPTDDADFDNDGDVDGEDFLIWQRGLGAGDNSDGDANGDNVVDGMDLDVWKQKFGVPAQAVAAIPEPASLALCGAALLAMLAARRRS
jgi:hypothetical protein